MLSFKHLQCYQIDQLSLVPCLTTRNNHLVIHPNAQPSPNEETFFGIFLICASFLYVIIFVSDYGRPLFQFKNHSLFSAQHLQTNCCKLVQSFRVRKLFKLIRVINSLICLFVSVTVYLFSSKCLSTLFLVRFDSYRIYGIYVSVSIVSYSDLLPYTHPHKSVKPSPVYT